MKIKRIISALSSAVVMLAPVAYTVHAAEETLPSGTKTSELESKVNEFIEDKKFASLGTAVFTKDDVLYSGYFGNVDQEEGIPADEDTVYDWGSITKTLTWVSVMQLYEQGKIDLDADIRTYLPDGFLRHLKYDDSITVMNLMNHNAGWCETTYSVWASKESGITDLGTMLQDVEPAQIYRPGEVTSYSNFGAALAGYIVERVSGEDYIDYVNEHICKPLGMEHTSIAPTYTDNEWVRERSLKLKGYMENPMTGSVMFNTYPRAFVKIYPAGSACGTVSDFVKYGQALLDESAPLFDKPGTQKKMFSGSLFVGDTDITVNSYGFWANHRNVDTLWHNGGTMQCSSMFEFDPDSGYGVIAITNGQAGADAVMGIPDLVFGEVQSDDIPTGDITEREDISGKYINTRSGFKGFYKGVTYFNNIAGGGIIDIVKKDDDTYKLRMGSEDNITVKSIGNGLYSMDDGETASVNSFETLSDGTMIFHYSAQDFVRDNNAPVKGALMLYFLLSGAAVFILFIVKIVLKATGKLKPYAGSRVILAAQIAKFTAFLVFFAMNIICKLGVERPVGMVWCIINTVCGALCAFAVLSDIKCLFSKSDEKGRAWKYILNIIFNGLIVLAVVWLELYRFWGC